ncbi:hypothetical protein [Microbacterium sp. 69-7]|uniref:hypothetical protein n=1 Tax=Microbacterium sp. 69-7 TaxID=1895784 RepID=UPI002586F7B4|nr:hypothetical protein [Microbacterium sp. 69-7]
MEHEYSRGLLKAIDQASRRHEAELAAQAESLKAGFIEETRRSNAATAERTRQETLETVLKALDLPGYRANGGMFHPFDASKTRINYPTDRFWADLTTTLEVRAERKAADERAATEAKIADLGKQAGIKPEESTDFGKYVAHLLSDPNGPSVVSLLLDESISKSYGEAQLLGDPRVEQGKSPKPKKGGKK